MTNSDNCSIYSGHSSDLHLPQTNLVVYQEGVYYSDVKFLIIFHQILKILLAILRDLKEF